MKTSSKLLAVAVLLLVTAAIVNALTLKSRFKAMRMHTSVRLAEFPVTDFRSIELSGSAPQGMALQIIVKRADRFAVRYTKYLGFIHVAQVGSTLKVTIDHHKKYEGNMRIRPEIIIECPELVAITAAGTPLDSLDLPEGTHVFTRLHHQKGFVTIEGFSATAMDVFAADGMEVTLDSLAIDSLTARTDRAGMVHIQRNALGHADLTVGNGTTITLDHTQIGTVTTDVAEKGQFIVKGTQLTARSALSAH
ncbi:hypothetical protein [Parapedobacter sp. 10938]|uniref:hypothetical protein n=1 Tax=Parapedobacter flavus TaxID=3110225 RepID=UPI002DBDE9A8|nr:hypothetical protein [Parapedobacter sp. 10938]MEC3882059.1 hypothetical protein [Parapedobacter sp. 10938]